MRMSVVHSCVYYFAQGQAEHANGGEAAAELATATGPRALPTFVLYCMEGVQFFAERESEEFLDELCLLGR